MNNIIVGKLSIARRAWRDFIVHLKILRGTVPYSRYFIQWFPWVLYSDIKFRDISHQELVDLCDVVQVGDGYQELTKALVENNACYFSHN